MLFFIDHNINLQVPNALSSLYLEHDFNHAFDVGLHELKDEELFETLASQQYDAIVTRDKNQLKNAAERAGLRSANLHWIGYQSKPHPGVLGLALETSTIISGLPFVLNSERLEPTAFTFRGIPSERTQRVIDERL